MICYKDMTFCTENNCAKFDGCFRALTVQVKINADEWWGKGEGEAPIAIFTGQPDCYVGSPMWDNERDMLIDSEIK